jgi:hypothetical protein
VFLSANSLNIQVFRAVADLHVKRKDLTSLFGKKDTINEIISGGKRKNHGLCVLLAEQRCQVLALDMQSPWRDNAILLITRVSVGQFIKQHSPISMARRQNERRPR